LPPPKIAVSTCRQRADRAADRAADQSAESAENQGGHG
jgi:hypothetical protein